MKVYKLSILFFLVALATTFSCEASHEDWVEVQYTFGTETFAIKFPNAPKEHVLGSRLQLTCEENEVHYSIACLTEKSLDRAFAFMKSRIPEVLASNEPYTMVVQNKGESKSFEWIKESGNSKKLFSSGPNLYFFGCSGPSEDMRYFFDSFRVVE